MLGLGLQLYKHIVAVTYNLPFSAEKWELIQQNWELLDTNTWN